MSLPSPVYSDFDFSIALNKLKEGKVISRNHQKYNNLVIVKVFNTIVCCSENREYTVINEWKPSSNDLLANDYYEIANKKVV